MPPARKVPKLHKKAISVKKGTEFSDILRQQFVVGKEIGQGGFGRIYEGIEKSTKKSVAIKMEPQGNGPLFTEMHVYMRILKVDMLEDWKRLKGLKFIGLPQYISSGSFTYENTEIRFLVIPKFAISLESIRESKPGNIFSVNETMCIAKTILYSLAYLHDQNYVHGDVKASNLMLESKTGYDLSHVVLIDFGLARKLPDEIIEKENKKQAHNGTPLFTSCDAHRGCLPSFRGDFEILIHNMLYWICGSLPWQDCTNDLEKVFQQKKAFISNAKKEIIKLIPEKKVALSIANLYSLSSKMAFIDKIDLEEALKLLINIKEGKEIENK
ncbi:Protein kinase domain-containing protein [Meloidogyne graminicola]|uniref:non-specific serine/threonine protein kinase n=1 Tax=Meloidogyne graminicola TaxID=189291 RepID=A0A8S9ZWD6_9BILA|nr:Protein kinase domain-containing protein [Meloidogyne graminicola]